MTLLGAIVDCSGVDGPRRRASRTGAIEKLARVGQVSARRASAPVGCGRSTARLDHGPAAFRAPRSNFMGAVEQSFLDEVAEAAGKDPIDFRLELLEKAVLAQSMDKPNAKNNDYEPDRYAGVLKLVREKSGWDQLKGSRNVGVSAYFCHDTYAANVLDLEMKDGQPLVRKVWCAVDCGVVVNPDAARNMTEGAILDGIGTALFGKLTFTKGVPDQQNFDRYRMIRMSEAPKEIEVHFVKNDIDPTGMGEPAYPPVFGALANALYKATGKRFYTQPFAASIVG